MFRDHIPPSLTMQLHCDLFCRAPHGSQSGDFVVADLSDGCPPAPGHFAFLPSDMTNITSSDSSILSKLLMFCSQWNIINTNILHKYDYIVKRGLLFGVAWWCPVHIKSSFWSNPSTVFCFTLDLGYVGMKINRCGVCSHVQPEIHTIRVMISMLLIDGDCQYFRRFRKRPLAIMLGKLFKCFCFSFVYLNN